MWTRLTDFGDRSVDITCACGNSMASGTAGLPELLAMSKILDPVDGGAGRVRHAACQQSNDAPFLQLEEPLLT